MNYAIASGIVASVPETRSREAGQACLFLVSLDSRAKQRTELWCSAWDDVAILAQKLVVGDHVSLSGALSHLARRGIVLAVKQLAIVRAEASELEPHEMPQTAEEPNELNWSNYLDHGREPGLRARKENS
jgi:hypothetical protein